MIRYRFTLKKVRHVKILNPPISTHGRMFFFFFCLILLLFLHHIRGEYILLDHSNIFQNSQCSSPHIFHLDALLKCEYNRTHSWISVKVDCIQVKKEYFIHFTFNCEFIVDKFNKRWKFSRYTNRYLHGEKNWI